MEKVTIIGTGLIGGSIGMALKQSKLQEVEIVGHDREPGVSAKAVKLGAVDRRDTNLISAVRGAGMVIIATPVMAIKDTMEKIGPHLAEDCIVTDTGSTKAHVMAWAEQLLPPTVNFVGGHPMAGKEAQGIDQADPELFKGCTYCVIPGKNASEESVRAVIGLVGLLQAKPYFVDPAEHDGFVAAVSHLPIILSSTLVSATSKAVAWREIYKLAATGFRDVSRLASGDPEMNRDICLTNKESVVRWIDEFIKELGEWRHLVAEGGEELGKAFISAWEARERWLKGVVAEMPRPEIPTAGETMQGVFLGQFLTRRRREPGKRTEGKTR